MTGTLDAPGLGSLSRGAPGPGPVSSRRPPSRPGPRLPAGFVLPGGGGAEGGSEREPEVGPAALPGIRWRRCLPPPGGRVLSGVRGGRLSAFPGRFIPAVRPPQGDLPQGVSAGGGPEAAGCRRLSWRSGLGPVPNRGTLRGAAGMPCGPAQGWRGPSSKLSPG